MPPYPIQNNAEAHRFEAQVDGHLATLDYQIRGSILQIDYVYVPAEIGGRGIGSALVEAAVAWGHQAGLQPYPVCGFARRCLERKA